MIETTEEEKKKKKKKKKRTTRTRKMRRKFDQTSKESIRVRSRRDFNWPAQKKKVQKQGQNRPTVHIHNHQNWISIKRR